MQIGFVFSLVFAIIITVFAINNASPVPINFLFTKVQVSQALVIFISAALGAIIVTLLGIVRQVKLSIKIKDQSKTIKTLESSNAELNNELEVLQKELVEDDKDINQVTQSEKDKVDAVKVSKDINLEKPDEERNKENHEENLKDEEVVDPDDTIK